jgi:GAF domain-containing protein
MTDLDIFQRALAAANGPEAVFQALETLAHKTVGLKVFTTMSVDGAAGLARRSYSNRPEAYPVSGSKPLHDDPWSDTVLKRHETHVMNDYAHIARTFPDHELILSLGCESCINVPVVVGGEVLGTVNCLDVAGHYTPDRVKRADSLKLPAAAAFLAARHFAQEGKAS